MSHPIWVRELKLFLEQIARIAVFRSHPIWVRELKRAYQLIWNEYYSRTPYGCVN